MTRVTQVARRRTLKWIALAVALSVGLAGWFIARPAFVLRQARQQLTTNPQQAAQRLEQLVGDAESDYPEAQLLWTRALLRSGRLDEALGCFSYIRQPASLDPDELLTLADEALAAGVPLLAAYAVNAVPKTSARWPDVLEKQQALCQLRGDWPSVVALGTELTALDPHRGQVWKRIAEAHEHLMDPPQAAVAYRKSLDLESDAERRYPALRRLVDLSINLGDVDEARRSFAELVSNRAPTADDRLLEARLQRLEGRVEAAWDTVQTVLASQPDNWPALELRATLAFDRGELDPARRDLQAVLKREPWNKQAHYKLGQVLIRIGQPDEARRHLEENRRLTALSMRILELQSKTASGQAEVERLTELAAAYEQLGQRETAARIRDQAWRQSP